MRNQFKYSARPYWRQRLFAFAAVVVINVFFGVCGALGPYNFIGGIAAIVLSSLSLCALLVVSIIADFESIRDLFSAPMGYGAFLTPVPRWKILLGRAAPIVVQDVAGLAVGATGMLVQMLILSDINPTVSYIGLSPAVWSLVAFLLGYSRFVLALFFGCTLSHSVFFPLRGRGFLAFLATVLALYLCSLADLALVPFGAMRQAGVFISISIYGGLGSIVYILLQLVKIAALFCATSYLMERKINL